MPCRDSGLLEPLIVWLILMRTVSFYLKKHEGWPFEN